ncbi:MAG: hypothetical protein GYA55_09170 [SAR324 cluster bacterium]|uniref:Uncharacterized protein n=1 Tax=SAR324 cluster bacterium TaxID=2024889 RepID=A0A7X9FS61_9DELT|nr:hypothetical protein [SAR324 cluster bacterium]
MYYKNNIRKIIVMILVIGTLSSCNTMAKVLNPFQETPGPEAYLGEKNDKALAEDTQKADKARAALEAMSSYQRTHAPQPYNPVIQPAVVRLMWIPDHLNKYGDLVPSHYYYLKVKSDEFAAQDAFELEGQLHKKGVGPDSSIPFAYEKDAEQ